MEEISSLMTEQTFAINTVWVALCAALIFVLPVDEAYRIRTGEKGGKSLN